MYTCTTHDVVVSVEPSYLDEESAPEKDLYVFAYTVIIRNEGKVPLRLTDRYWRITDALGRSREVRGEGVVGQQPLLQPGETFEYSSGAPLAAPSGIMTGSYTMRTAAGDRIDQALQILSHWRRYSHRHRQFARPLANRCCG